MTGGLCIIPARGGSKGLKRKNLRDLGGKPLIGYAINTALASGCFDHVMVSTEDDEIASVARSLGAEVPFLRSEGLAGDNSPLQSVISDVLKRYRADGFIPQAYGIMLPTSPFRSCDMVRKMVGKCVKGTCRAASTVRRIRQQPLYAIEQEGAPCYLLRDGNQKFSGDYYRTYGAFFAYKLASHLRTEQIHIHVLEHPEEGIDIDTYEDLLLAETVMRRGMYAFDHEQ